PNLFGDDPGIQIRGTRTTQVDTSVLERAESALGEGEITLKGAVLSDSDIKLRFDSADDQLTARDLLQSEFDKSYTIALALLPATPSWLQFTGAQPMNLGLDLRGGVHFLMEVDMASAIKKREENYVGDIKTTLKDNKTSGGDTVRYRAVNRSPDSGLIVRMRNSEDLEGARFILERELPELSISETELNGEQVLRAIMRETSVKELMEFALEQNMTTLRNRIDELGVAEPVVQRQGDRRIVVQLPGVQDTGRAKEILGRTATLEIKLVDEENSGLSSSTNSAPPGSQFYRARQGGQILLKKRLIYSGDNIVNAAASLDTQNGTPIVSITLDDLAAKKNQRVTGENIGRRMAVIYQETVSEPKLDENNQPVLDDDGNQLRNISYIEEVITAPVIRDQLGKRFQIEGLDSVDEARDLALMLRAGALAAPVQIIEERTVGPALGQDNVNQGKRAVTVGFILVLIFMIVYYRTFGWVANLALALNLVLIVAVLSLFQATLTLPGVAGIVLTVGMAVDANVLIFERIREEIRNGNSPQASIHVGYDRAFSTIVDANITTLIAAVILYGFGTGPIKGFAVTLSIGIVTSMFTAIIVTRGVVNWIYGGKRVEKLAI
ncbi:MAG: protein translocase subunit SecD, partial [Gammaproteobacteria bacterium]|nr:protein translocase subunit SecD [Gammaproteobacteria bacterium]